MTDDAFTTEALAELASLVNARRLAAGHGRGQTVEGAAALGGVSPVTWRKVERGQTVQIRTYGAIDVALGWTPGTAVTFLRTGTRPPVVEEPATPSTPRLDEATHEELTEELLRRLRHLAPARAVSSQRQPLAAAGLNGEHAETAESVEARPGGIAGLPMSREHDATYSDNPSRARP